MRIKCNQFEIREFNEPATSSFEEAVLKNLSQMYSQVVALYSANKKRRPHTAAVEYEEGERY